MRSVRGKLYFASALLLITGVTSVYRAPEAHADQITSRNLTLQANGTTGGSTPGGVVNHVFNFTVPNVGGGNIGSIRFLYCTTPADAGSATCVAPTGISVNAATAGTQTGATGFSVAGPKVSTNDAGAVSRVNGFYLTRVAAPVSASTAVSLQVTTITNPTPTNTTFFVRIATYTGTDGATGLVDTGSVAASTATQIVLTGIMPETLIFCTGATISLTLGIPDCTTATAGTINFNQLFSPTDTAVATSQMAASTNATTGYSITVNGGPLTSGSNTIPAKATLGVPIKGTSEFGMNLKANTATAAVSFPGTSAEVNPAPNGGDLRGQAQAGYSTQDQFKFTSGDVVAASNFNTAGPTNAQIYTSSYIVDVAGNQLAGTYTTTLTYICTPTY
jgi:hypothetical protein